MVYRDYAGGWPDSTVRVECSDWKCPSRCGGCRSREQAAEVWNTRADLTHTSPQVKPLVWEGCDTYVYTAWTEFGSYNIDRDGDGWWCFMHECHGDAFEESIEDTFIDDGEIIERLKQEAEADCQRRFLSMSAHTSPEPMAASVLIGSREARKTAFEAMWKVAERHSLEATNENGARYSITGDVINELWYFALIALAKDRGA